MVFTLNGAPQGWRVKIRDRERTEPPHATVFGPGDRKWRFNLRDGQWMDRRPPPQDVPYEVAEFVRRNIGELKAAWDRMYPENPIGGEDE